MKSHKSRKFQHCSKIVELVKKERVVTSSEVARALDVSWNTAESYLKDLALEGKIERIQKKADKKIGVTLWMKK